MNVNSGGPHILLFERDQQLTTLLSGELAQAGLARSARRQWREPRGQGRPQTRRGWPVPSDYWPQTAARSGTRRPHMRSRDGGRSGAITIAGGRAPKQRMRDRWRRRGTQDLSYLRTLALSTSHNRG